MYDKPILEWTDDEVIKYADGVASRVARKEPISGDVRMILELACRLRAATTRTESPH